MPTTFQELLDASVRYLQELKAAGIRHVVVSPENLAALRHLRHPLPTKAAFQPPVPAPAPQHRESTPLSTPAFTPSPDPTGGALVTPLSTPLTARVEAPVPNLAGAAKEQALLELRNRALACMKCPPLAASRKNVVFGVGNIHADLMFVGEAPGADEDATGEPFVGKAGQLLTRIIETMGLTRNEVYIANILKCRPDTPGQSYGNRKPTADEMKTCSPYLHAQIDLIQPKVLVALGSTAIEGLLGNLGSISRLRGQWKVYRNTPLMPTYHPAYLVRNQGLQEKRKVWEDMLQVMEKLGLAIDARQRGFFLRNQSDS